MQIGQISVFRNESFHSQESGITILSGYRYVSRPLDRHHQVL